MIIFGRYQLLFTFEEINTLAKSEEKETLPELEEKFKTNLKNALNDRYVDNEDYERLYRLNQDLLDKAVNNEFEHSMEFKNHRDVNNYTNLFRLSKIKTTLEKLVDGTILLKINWEEPMIIRRVVEQSEEQPKQEEQSEE